MTHSRAFVIGSLLSSLATTVTAVSLRRTYNTSDNEPSRKLNIYLDPKTWLEETSPNSPDTGLSCVIRHANVPNGQGLVLTATNGGDVSLEGRRWPNDNQQRWILQNRRIFQGTWHTGPAWNVYNDENGNLPYLESDDIGNTNMGGSDDNSGRQLWSFIRNPDNPGIKYDHQYEIRVAGGVYDQFHPNLFPGRELLGLHRRDDEHTVELTEEDHLYFDMFTWELIDCYEVPALN